MSEARFHWLVGVENALIPDMGVDQLAWSGHKARWREDLALAKATGADLIRYGVTWPELNPAPGRYDWSWSDAVVDELERLGLEPVWDLIHFGAPGYLAGGFLDPDYREAVTRFAGAFAARYRGSVRRITPFNEPYIGTYFRAGWGIWPPHLKGREGFAKLLYPIVEGVRSSIRAIRESNPEAEIWLNDGADHFHPAAPELAEEAARRTEERYAAFDLLLGLARPGQATFEWLRAAGYPEAGLRAEAVEIEVIGLDYYPDTEHELYLDEAGASAIRRASAPLGVCRTAAAYFERYRRPLFIAESSTGGDDETRQAWLEYNLREIRRARAAGVPIVGYTWWPLFDHIDWNTLLQRLEGVVCDSGLYHLRPTVHDRQPSAALGAFREAVRGGV